ncbi:hypothetical protein OBV_05090 [Oscillibacter valericigenes Sjm18-20]|nr:hypothetical protein OBV_05090 [Oscillibacter valericigenes Sjm18-20]
MAYNELIKDFEKIRDYMREFYIYGFKSREEYDAKSARSYDNERRRIGSWLGDYMGFRQDAAGKNVFLSVDSRSIPHNPLYQAFRAKSFTDKDITLHFYILDLFSDGAELTSGEIVNLILERYLAQYEEPMSFDESTVRKKLKEYEELGLLTSRKRGREVVYCRSNDQAIDLDSWMDAAAFFSEAAPLGVIGAYLLDKYQTSPAYYGFKHHYLLHALDSSVLCDLLHAIDERRAVELTVRNLRTGQENQRTLCPLNIYASTQSGRQYLLGYHYRGKRLLFFRIDAIKKVTIGNCDKNYETYLEYQKRFDLNLWGVSTSSERGLDHIEMTVHIGNGEQFILDRLEREKRHGRCEMLDEHTCRFVADVYDALEMIPWLRTFIGRIEKLQCSNPSVVDTFYEDLRQMNKMYGGGGHAV